jgi:UDP-N-acetylmuramoyl-L-alanyl-D-glutamate--2,6-diaminopimelate ligase
MEVSSHAIVQNRIEGIGFLSKIFTSFSQDHLDFHKSMQEYKKVKESFFKDDAIKVIHGKPKHLDGAFRIVEVGGYDFRIKAKNLYVLEEPLIESISMAGEFNKINFSLALKSAEILTNENPEKLKQIVSEFKGVAGRMEIVSKNPLIIVDFAHTPDGMENVLKSVEGKKIVVFGAGGNRDKDKRKKMGEVASRYADFIIITNDNPRCEAPALIAEDIKKGVSKNFEIILDRREAIKKAVMLAKKLDAVLFVLGKGDEKYIEYCGKKEKYSDKEEIVKNL